MPVGYTGIMPRIAPSISLSVQEREQLIKWRSRPSTPQKYIPRIDIILLADEGLENKEISERGLGTTNTVAKWRNRYAKEGIDGLKDTLREGRPKALNQQQEEELLALVLTPPPEHRTHWTVRTIAERLGHAPSTVNRCLRAHNIQPHRLATFKYSNDPQLVEKIVDVVGLYLNPPEKGFVICVDEKTQIQALDRTQTTLPMKPGSPERHTHDYKRHGTIDLFAALNIATGEVLGECRPSHNGRDFLAFLKNVRKAWPRKTLHIICDNLSTHKCPEVMEWLEKNKRVHIHHTPTSASWMNQIETWFSILQRQMISRGRHGYVQELNEKLMAFIDSWNERSHPFEWTKTPYEIIRKAVKDTSTN